MHSDNADNLFDGGVYATALHILVKCRICSTGVLPLVPARS